MPPSESSGGRSLLGRLAGIASAWREPQRHEVIAPEALDAWRERGARIIDVREPGEYAGGHVPGAVNVPLADFLADLEDSGAPVVLVCATGNRSATAAHALAAQDFGDVDVADLGGGTHGWIRSGRTLEGRKRP